MLHLLPPMIVLHGGAPKLPVLFASSSCNSSLQRQPYHPVLADGRRVGKIKSAYVMARWYGGGKSPRHRS